MIENFDRVRSWRFDATAAAELVPDSSASPSDPTAPGRGAPQTPPGAVSDPGAWRDRWRGLVESFRAALEPGETDEEEVVHDFAELLSTAADFSTVGSGLVEAVKRLTQAREVVLVFEDDPGAVPGAAAPPEVGARRRFGTENSLQLAVENGAQRWARLRLAGLPAIRGRRCSSSPSRPLNTLCILAAMAFDGITNSRLFDVLELEDLDGAADSTAEARPVEPDPPSLRAAACLHAVLPYALKQAHRHREPLSILSIGVDRIAAIHETLGPEFAAGAVNRVAAAVTDRLRSSDVVGRMDDDGILAVLPNATASDALRIAGEIREKLGRICEAPADFPSLTVSIGVASFPIHAGNVDSLLLAASRAAAAARRTGGGIASAAEELRRPSIS